MSGCGNRVGRERWISHQVADADAQDPGELVEHRQPWRQKPAGLDSLDPLRGAPDEPTQNGPGLARTFAIELDSLADGKRGRRLHSAPPASSSRDQPLPMTAYRYAQGT